MFLIALAMFTLIQKKSFKDRFKEATPAAAAWVHIEEEEKSKKSKATSLLVPKLLSKHLRWD